MLRLHNLTLASLPDPILGAGCARLGRRPLGAAFPTCLRRLGYKSGRGIGNENFRVDYGGLLRVIGRGQIQEAFLTWSIVLLEHQHHLWLCTGYGVNIDDGPLFSFFTCSSIVVGWLGTIGWINWCLSFTKFFFENWPHCWMACQSK